MSRYTGQQDKEVAKKQLKRRRIQHWTSYVVLGLAIFAMTFFGVCTPESTRLLTITSGSAARVGSEVISDLEFRRSYQRFFSQWQQQNPERQYNPEQDRIPEQVLQNLVSSRLTLIAAQEVGLSASEEEAIKLIVNNIKGADGNFDKELLRNFLQREMYTEAEFTDVIKRDLVSQKYFSLLGRLDFVSDSAAELDFKRRETKLSFEYIKLTPALIDRYIDQNSVNTFLADKDNLSKVEKRFAEQKDSISQKAEVKARHILVSHSEARNPVGDAAKRTKDQAFSRANEILAKVKTPGSDFVAIAKKETDEVSGKNSGGDLGWFTADRMVPEFSEAAFALANGEISGVVTTPFGYHIIKVEGKKEAAEPNFEAEKVKLARAILRDEKAADILSTKSKSYIEALVAGKDINSLLNADGLKWEASEPVSLTANFIPGLGMDSSLTDAAFSLSKVGDFYPEVLVSGQNYFILRLKNKIPADLATIVVQREFLSQMIKYQNANSIREAYSNYYKNVYEKAGRIKMSKKHINIDRATASGG